MPTIPDFPFPTDDSGPGDNGTEVNLAWTEDLEAAIAAVTYGADNPGISASDIVDEVVTARGDEATLNDLIQSVIFGTENPGVSAATIIDEVVEARDDNPDLNDRLDNFVADEIDDATTDTRGLLSDGTTSQSISGDKVFEDDIDIDGALTIAAGTGTEVARVGGSIEYDGTARATSGTTETDQSTYTLPANTLSRDGMVLVLRAAGKYAANANNKRSAIYFAGAALIQHPNNAVNEGSYVSICRIRRLTASTQVCHCQTLVGGPGSVNAANGTAGSGMYTAIWDNLAVDLTATVAIKTTSSCATAGTNTQTEFEVSVEG